MATVTLIEQKLMEGEEKSRIIGLKFLFSAPPSKPLDAIKVQMSLSIKMDPVSLFSFAKFPLNGNFFLFLLYLKRIISSIHSQRIICVSELIKRKKNSDKTLSSQLQIKQTYTYLFAVTVCVCVGGSIFKNSVCIKLQYFYPSFKNII